jgi:mannonate dehydratase
LAAGGLGALAAAGWGIAAWARPRLWNPCHAVLPPRLAEHPVVRAAWQDIVAEHVWDCHVHIAGTGDSDSGITTAPEMASLLSPVQFAQRLFYLNAGCVHDAPGQVDVSYVERMLNLVDGLRPGAKLMLFAFDRCHDEAGEARPERTAFHVPNAYARDLARRHAEVFEWVCSIHPYRPDAVAALEAAAAEGARAVKWLPAAMGMDPASPRCDTFYDALTRLNVPLISHAGEENAVHGAGQQAYNNPLRLRRALDRGVRVVVAHCASIGHDRDLDQGEHGAKVTSFDLFARLMAEPRYENLLFGDISAITQRNRDIAVIKAIVEREAWHGRLLNGSDYPLPGVMPLFAPSHLAAQGLLDAAVAPVLDELHTHNPLLFDFVLKRNLRWRGRRLADGIFHTRDFFLRSTS